MSIDENVLIEMMEVTKELSHDLQTQIKKLFNIIEMQNELLSNILISQSDNLGKEDGAEPLPQLLPIEKNQARRQDHFITNRMHGSPGSLFKSFPVSSFSQAGLRKKGKLYVAKRKSSNRQTSSRLQTRLKNN